MKNHGLLLDYEQAIWQQGTQHILGIDEVGRGCLAGPVVIAGVCFKPNHQPIPGIKDSKMVSVKKRLELQHQILKQVAYYSIQVVPVKIIDRINILQATLFGMEKVIQQISLAQQIVIDGNKAPKIDNKPVKTVVKGDQKIYSIAAASILAKVYRDAYMRSLHQKFPEYDWEHNVGYGTAKHRFAIQKFGPTIYHRRKFIQKIICNAQLPA